MITRRDEAGKGRKSLPGYSEGTGLSCGRECRLERREGEIRTGENRDRGMRLDGITGCKETGRPEAAAAEAPDSALGGGRKPQHPQMQKDLPLSQRFPREGNHYLHSKMVLLHLNGNPRVLLILLPPTKTV